LYSSIFKHETNCEAIKSSSRGDSDTMRRIEALESARGAKPLLNRGLGMILGSAVRVRSPRPR